MNRSRSQTPGPRRRRAALFLPAALGAGMMLTSLFAVAPRPAARAHDLWLEPDVLLLTGGREQDVAVAMHVGERFHSEEEKPLRRKDVASFQLLRADRPAVDLLAGAREDQKPAARFRLEGGGAALLVADRTPKFLEQDADHFNRYLAEENATAAIALRARAGQNGQPVRERYTRFLKALVQPRDAGAPAGGPDALHRRPTGQRLEILLDANPARLRPGEPLGVRVLFEGQPLAAAALQALHRDRPGRDATRTLAAVTDDAGRASFSPDAPGAWMVRLVHLRPLPAATGAATPGEPQWESFWAAYTFGVNRTGPADPESQRPGPPPSAGVR